MLWESRLATAISAGSASVLLAFRNALDTRDGFEGKKRAKAYGLLSEFAAHPTSPGFQLVAPEGLGLIGPFFSARYLKAWTEEVAKLLVPATLNFAMHFESVAGLILAERASFVDKAARWRQSYLAPDPEQASA